MADFNPSNPSAAPVEPPEKHSEEFPMEIFRRALIAVFFVALLFPAAAAAHPMGNFSINHYSKLTLKERSIHVDTILDFAEIPTFQMFPEARNGGVDSRVRTLASEWASRLLLRLDEQTLPLELLSSSAEVIPGAGGLATLRVTMELEARGVGRAGWAGTLHFSDRNFPERIGWKEIVMRASPPRGFPEGNPFQEDRSQALTRYPEDVLSDFPNIVEGSIRIGDTASGTSAGIEPTTSGGVAGKISSPDRLSQILGEEDLPLRTVLLGILVAFSLGALHALSPGHGKTVVASCLVGARGTARHAAFLGAIVTFTHTIGVFILGLVVLFLSNTIVPEQIYPWIGFLSGLTILGVGVNLFRQRLGHLTHSHPHDHSHEIPSEITFRNLLALGFSGGIVPCPSALVVLLSSIALHRVGTGLLFIVAFSLGLASVLVAIGILVVRASRLVSRFDSERSVLRFVPVASAAIIVVLGLGMAVQALWGVTLDRSSLVLSGQAIAALSLGLLLGLKHATDADHVVAVTTFVSQESSILRSCWIGAFWGVGHTLSLAVAGVLVIGLKVNVPEWLADRLELGVAAMLVLLGASVILRTLRPKAELHRHYHAHDRDAKAAHSHWHIHLLGHSHDHSGWTHARPLLAGIVHGAAGSAALMLMVLSTIRSPLEAFLYILIFGLGSILGMVAISFLLAVPLRWVGSYKPVQLLAGVFSCLFGLFLGAEIYWMSLR
jgi:nickel/cobalt exporter